MSMSTFTIMSAYVYVILNLSRCCYAATVNQAWLVSVQHTCSYIPPSSATGPPNEKSTSFVVVEAPSNPVKSTLLLGVD